MPVSVANYLSVVNQSIPVPDQIYSFALISSIVFDYTQLGSNDTIRYGYNEHGIMSHYQIFYNQSLALSLELMSFSLGGFEPLLLMLILAALVSTAIITILIILRKRMLQKSKKSTKLKRQLRKIR